MYYSTYYSTCERQRQETQRLRNARRQFKNAITTVHDDNTRHNDSARHNDSTRHIDSMRHNDSTRHNDKGGHNGNTISHKASALTSSASSSLFLLDSDWMIFARSVAVTRPWRVQDPRQRYAWMDEGDSRFRVNGNMCRPCEN